MKPNCKLCETRHWTYEPHKLVTKSSDEEPLESVTVTESKDEIVTSSTVRISPEKMEEEFKAGRMNYTHGGARVGAGRPKVHKDAAERQKAYRQRRSD